MVEIHGHKINFNDKQIKQKLQKVLIAELKCLLLRKKEEIAWEEDFKRGIITFCGDIKAIINWETLEVFYIGIWGD